MGEVLDRTAFGRLLAEITDWRVSDPDRPLRAARQRKRRGQLTEQSGGDDGKLTLLAADHPARGAVQIGEEPLGMADRGELLWRVAEILAARKADGILASMDILEDLLVLSQHLGDRQGQPFLDDTVLVASLNRGGIDGMSWELDDRWTGPTVESCHRWNLDAVKLLVRIEPSDAGSLETLVMAADAVRASEAVSMPIFVEVLAMEKAGGRLRVVRTAEAIARAAGIAAALGNSSRRMWLKLPLCDDFQRVAVATTLPITVLGGPIETDMRKFFAELSAALSAAANVRGTIIGRNALYPRAHRSIDLAGAIHDLVHGGRSADDVLRGLGAL